MVAFRTRFFVETVGVHEDQPGLVNDLLGHLPGKEMEQGQEIMAGKHMATSWRVPAFAGALSSDQHWVIHCVILTYFRCPCGRPGLR
jgi:hypothetical protein